MLLLVIRSAASLVSRFRDLSHILATFGLPHKTAHC